MALEVYSKATRYAVWFLGYIAWAGRNRDLAFSVDDLSDGTGVSRTTVAKVLHALAKGGVLESKKGPHGGYRLSRGPDQIRLLDILVTMEGRSRLTECIWGYEGCSASRPCPLHPKWEPLMKRLETFLEETTLAGVVAAGGEGSFFRDNVRN